MKTVTLPESLVRQIQDASSMMMNDMPNPVALAVAVRLLGGQKGVDAVENLINCFAGVVEQIENQLD